jgi:hypothetical protein
MSQIKNVKSRDAKSISGGHIEMTGPGAGMAVAVRRWPRMQRMALTGFSL